MSNKNFGEPWEGKIERIRENLREGRYALQDGIFPIVKELIQNAEDAQATKLLVAWDHGIADAVHPLLRGPGLLAVNDGRFDSANARAIREMGLSSKAADSSSIGKFGLGMKSVFHLGEVFFFVAVDELDKQLDADVRSPWSTDEGGLHADWDDFAESDHVAIAARVRSLFGSGRFFCLWVPLRTSTNCGNVDPIESYYPGDEVPGKLLGSRHFEQVAAILPLLAHLGLVQFRFGDEESSAAQDIRVTDASSRRSPLAVTNTAGDGTLAAFEGDVASKNANLTALLNYSGLEQHFSDIHLCMLEKDESKKWPKRFATNKSTGRSEQVPEKAKQHSAVCFTATRRPSGRAHLRIHWAVFLPLGQPEMLDIGNIGWDVELVLHGWFFPNSGRTEVEGLRQEAPDFDSIHDSATVRLAWNHRLARCGTLPLLPMVCAAIARHCNWDDATRTAITTAIQKSNVYLRFRADICQRDALVRRVTKNGQFEWHVIASDAPVYKLPDSPDELVPSTVFPGLRLIAEQQVIVLQGNSRLTANSAEQSWPTEVVRQLLRSVNASDLINVRSQCEYFVRFLDCATSEPAWSLFPNELVSLTRSALISINGTVTDESRETVRRFLCRVPSDRCIRLSLEITDESAVDLFLTLCKSTNSIIWIPVGLWSAESKCDGQLAAAEALVILKALSKWAKRKPTAQQADRLGIVAAQVFRATRELALLLPEAGALELFSGMNCREKKEIRLSWRDVIDHHRRRVLFVKPSPMAYQLQEALATDSIVLVSRDLSDVIFSNREDAPSQCREGQLLDALAVAEKPGLSAPAQRRKLFETMLKFAEGRRESHFRETVRFLLHARPDRVLASESLLVQGDTGSNVWWRIVQISLASLDQAWRIVDPAFSAVLSADDRREFSIEAVDADVAGRLAATVDQETFNSLRPTPAEYGVLLKQISDDVLLRRLPIHEDMDGNFVSISANSFWQGKWTLPSELQHKASILKKADDEPTWKRQQQLTTPLDAVAVIDIVLALPGADQYWSLIMDCLAEAIPLPEATIVRLKTTAWAPTSVGTVTRPENVLYLPRLKEDVARLVADHPGVYVDPDALAPSMQSHSAFNLFLTTVVPGTKDALAMLGTLLLEDERNAVGNTGVSFEDWLGAFQTDESVLFPQIGLLRAVSANLPNAAESTFGELQIPISAKRTRELLAFLIAAHAKQRGLSQRRTIVRVFGKYLRQLLASTNFHDGIQDIQLPNSEGDWKSPRALSLTNDGVAASHVLDPQVEEEIGSLFPVALLADAPVRSHGNDKSGSPSTKEPDWNVEAASERLRTYFDSWRDLVPNEQIGGFLALLGNDPGIQTLAQAFLGRNRTLEETRERFGLPEAQCGYDPNGYANFEDAKTMIAKQRVVVEIADEPTVSVMNLFGQKIAAPRNRHPTTLFVGYGNRNNPFPHRISRGLRVRCFRLNAIDAREFSEAELSRLLRDSAVKFIGEAYNSVEHQTRFRTTWDELAASDQLDIRITQSRIIEHGFLILDQYGLRSDPELARVLDRWDAAERLKGEREIRSLTTNRSVVRDPDREMLLAREGLRRLFEEQPTTQTQQHVLNAVQHRIANYYQYKPSSIPFEIFQNADDAYAELNLFFSGAFAENRREVTFDILWQPSRVVFIHFGRRINQYPLEVDRAVHGFDNDLWKMSVLSLSNKGQGTDVSIAPVTGKFGLGFKSVFLACDRPRLLSGRLAFEFVGGIYPRRLIGEERRILDEFREGSGHGDPQATIIDLELREGVDATEVVQRFQKLAHILVVFARQIRQCVCGEEGTETIWQATIVPGTTGCQTGELTPIHSAEVKAQPHRVLLFQTDAGAFLFALGSRGFVPFKADIPTIWVTAPTEEELHLGFLVNGPFALDVGRAQLARDPAQNHKSAYRLGQHIGKQLAEFFTAFSDRTSQVHVRSALRFASDATPFDIWNSLWDWLVVATSERASNDQPADQLIRDILWQSPENGAASFYSQYEAIPVRLPGKHFETELVRLSDVRFAIRGVLAQHDRRPEFNGYALACICSWPSYLERVGNGKLVSYERVIKPIEKLCPSLIQNITAISLVEILRWECPHVMVDPQKADRFGKLLTREFLDQITDQAETNRIREILDTAEFLASDGHYHPARELLISRIPSGDCGWRADECQRTGFAPRSRILSDQYGENGLQFFVACREKLSASPAEMASWIFEARDHVTRKATLVYLADGDAGRSVQVELCRQGLAGTWLADLVNAPSFRELSASQQHRLADLLPRNDASALLDNLLRSVHTSVHSNPRRVLQNIHEWWSAEAPQRIREYEQRIYPNGTLPYLADESDEHAHDRRKDWVTLFLIGLTHTMGRTVAEQHRGFLRQCERDGRLDMIASSERQPGPWINWIESFLDQQLDDSRFLQWMKQFVGIYQVSRYLDDYIEVFLAAERFNRPFALTQLTNTRASVQFQAGGISAPPLSRVLGMGQCFVLRELNRHGILSNQHTHPHCFVPVARVRRMLIDLGCDTLATSQHPVEWSREIHGFLRQHLGGEAATFQGAFDIPLQIVADDVSLQVRFFETVFGPEDDDSALWFDDDITAASEDR